jgi:ferredoxin
MPEEIARIVVDRNLCIGSGVCVSTLPKVFELDDENISTVVDPEGATKDEIFEAAEGCPTGAISLYDAAGKQLYPKPPPVR